MSDLNSRRSSHRSKSAGAVGGKAQAEEAQESSSSSRRRELRAQEKLKTRCTINATKTN